MENEVTYIFNADDLRKLLDSGADYVLIKTSIEPRYEERIGIVRIVAEAYGKGQMLMSKTSGCPVPPCSAPGS